MPKAALHSADSLESSEPLTTPDPSDEIERRAWVRYPCTMETACNVRKSIHSADAAAQDHWRATVRNLSVKGLGLLLSRRFEPKTVVQVQLESRNRAYTRTVHVRVTRVARGPGGRWLIGGVFLGQLSKEELRRLL